MTTRAQLESEREALADLRNEMLAPSAWHAALTASIARIDALLSIDDGHADVAAYALAMLADARPQTREYNDALRTIAEIVRRS